MHVSKSHHYHTSVNSVLNLHKNPSLICKKSDFIILCFMVTCRFLKYMDPSSPSLRNPWIVYFSVPIFTFACGDLTMFFMITTLILCSSASLFLKHSKHSIHVISHQHQHHYQEHELDLTYSEKNGSNPISNVVAEASMNVGSPDSCSLSEIIGQFSRTTEQDSDFDRWQNFPDCSDGSISDEESLIEIELPSGHYVGYKSCKAEGEAKLCRRQKSSDSVLCWPELIEEENMIEIDISIGSIKCSRFEIKA